LQGIVGLQCVARPAIEISPDGLDLLRWAADDDNDIGHTESRCHARARRRPVRGVSAHHAVRWRATPRRGPRWGYPRGGPAGRPLIASRLSATSAMRRGG